MKSKTSQPVRPTLNSERSPSVHYANWKEAMLLEKQLTTLHRTERGLLHRITVDQKVIFRRFQAKLQRSKLAHVQLQGNRNLEKELRAASMRRLHSECHRGPEGDSDFLSKLEKRPYNVEDDVNNKPIVPAKNRKPVRSAQPTENDVTKEEVANLVNSVMNEQPITNTRQNLRSLSALGYILQASNLSTVDADCELKEKLNRIKSAKDVDDIKHKMQDLNLPILIQNMEPGSHSQNETLNGDNTKNKASNLPLISPNSRLHPSQFLTPWDNNRNTLSPKDGRTVSLSSLSNSSLTGNASDACADTKLNGKQGDISWNSKQKISGTPRQRSPTISHETNSLSLINTSASRNTDRSVRRKKASIFEEAKRPDYRAQRLAVAKAVDHTDIVRHFCEGLDVFGPGLPNFDYYASKMQADAKHQAKSSWITSLPGTPEEIYRKYTGDQTIKCITLPRLKFDRRADDDDDDNYDPNQNFDYLFVNHPVIYDEKDDDSLVSWQE